MSEFSAMIPARDPYTGAGWSKDIGQPIGMQPVMVGTYPSQAPPASGLANLSILQQYNEFSLKPVTDNPTYTAQILDGRGEMIFNVDTHSQGQRWGRRGRIGGARMNFLTPSAQILFTCDRDEYESVVTGPGGVELGDVYSTEYIRNFVLTSKTGGPQIDLVPRGSMGSAVCCAFNACLMDEYSINLGGSSVGSIRCARKGSNEGHKILFDTELDVQSKALVLSAAIVINELYFSPQACYGNVGKRGAMWVTVYGLLAIAVPIVIILYFFVDTATKKSK